MTATRDNTVARRPDLDTIVALIPKGAKVLDLGCGDGALLERLVREKGIEARGVELSEESVRAAIGRGLSVRHGNIEEGLADYPTGYFDYVILSQTLAYLDHPIAVVKEMLRVGRRAVISFDNAGYWRFRWRALRGQGMGFTLASGEPRARAITLKQFDEFCVHVGAEIERGIYLTDGRNVAFLPSLFAEIAIYVIKGRNDR